MKAPLPWTGRGHASLRLVPRVVEQALLAAGPRVGGAGRQVQQPAGERGAGRGAVA